MSAMPAPFPAPPSPFSCPRCLAQAPAGPAPQICGPCRGTFVLRAGARVDATVKPPPIDPRLPTIKMRTAGLVIMQSSIVAPDGVLQGALDPVTGLIPMDQSGVFFADIVSVAVWRTLDVARLVLVSIILLPLALFLLAVSTGFAPALIVSVPLAVLTGFTYYHLIVVRRNFARVCGSMRMVTLQFDSPMRRRMRFHDELLRRAGLSPSPIP
jgi:hypothetical protein